MRSGRSPTYPAVTHSAWGSSRYQEKRLNLTTWNIHAPQLSLRCSSFFKMSSKDKIVIAFDLYGTLLSTESIAKELSSHFGQEQANKIAALWRRFAFLMLKLIMEADLRRYQLEYTWRMNSMSKPSCTSPFKLLLIFHSSPVPAILRDYKCSSQACSSRVVGQPFGRERRQSDEGL